MDLDVFHRAPLMDASMPQVWPVHTPMPRSQASLAAGLTMMTGCTLFGDLLLCMLVSSIQWYTAIARPIDQATQILKRMLHICYPNGIRDDILFLEAKRFATAARRKSFWSPEEVRALQTSLRPISRADLLDLGPQSFTLHDALNCVIYIDILKDLKDDGVPVEPLPHTVYDTWEYDTDHIIACLLSIATVTGVIIKKHFDLIPSLPKLPMELQYKPTNNKWKNYLVCVSWTFLIMAHLVKAETKNEFVHIMTKAKTLFVERYILDAVKKAAPHMLPDFLLLGNIIYRLHGAMFKMRDFMAVKGGLGTFLALAPMGPDESCYGMYYKFPLTNVNHDLPISKHALGIAHSCVLIVKTFQHLWTFLTVDKAWTKASNFDKVVFVDEIPMPTWCFTEAEFKELRKIEVAKEKRVIELELQSFFE
jgi:hypothetical protein